MLIEQAETLGEPPEDPLLLFSVLFGSWVTNYGAFNGDALCDFAEQSLALAERQTTTGAQLIAHRMMGLSLMSTGDFLGARAHLDKSVALYDPGEHRPLANRFNADPLVASLSFRSVALWLLGYPVGALLDTSRALKQAREIGSAGTSMTALLWASLAHMECGDYCAANAEAGELAALANEKNASLWKAGAVLLQGSLLGSTGDASKAIQMITVGLHELGSTGATVFKPLWTTHLATAYAELGQIDEALRWIGEATTALNSSKETWFQAEVHRAAGEIALKSSKADKAKAEAYFDRALDVARTQQAKSWELRAAMSMARLWRDQGKRTEARELLAPVYGWFTEGFETRDLKEAKALLDELAS